MPKLPDIVRIIEQHSIDIISINETHLDNTINNFEVNIPGFSMYRNDRNRHGGGVAFYVRENISHTLRADLSMSDIESIWVEVNAPDGTSYLICSMYRPPSASHDYYDKMIENIELVSMLNKEIVIFGDLNFNYKIDESLSSNPVHLIENLFQLSQIVTEPTRKTLTSSTLLDVILTSLPEKHIETRVLTTAFSDHYSFFTVIDTIKHRGKDWNHKYIRFRDFKHFDEQPFVNDILQSEILENVISQTYVLKGWYMWKNEFLKISNKHAPFVERRVKSRSNPLITPNIVKLMYRRDFLHKRTVTLKDESAWDEYKNMRNAVNREVNITKIICYDNVVTFNRNEPKILWRKINDLVRAKKSSNSNVHGISASEFNRYFSTIGKKSHPSSLNKGCPSGKILQPFTLSLLKILMSPLYTGTYTALMATAAMMFCNWMQNYSECLLM